MSKMRNERFEIWACGRDRTEHGDAKALKISVVCGGGYDDRALAHGRDVKLG